MSAINTPKRDWHAFARHGSGAIDVGEGLNAQQDGPERLVGSLVGFSPADARMALTAPRLFQALSDLEAEVSFRLPLTGDDMRAKERLELVLQAAQAAMFKALNG